MRHKKTSRGPNNLLTFGGLGIELAGILAVLIVGGWWLDGWLGTSPWLLLVGAMIGIVGCIYKVWLIWRRMFQDEG